MNSRDFNGTLDVIGTTLNIVDRPPTKPESYCWSGSPEPDLFDLTLEHWPLYTEDPYFVDLSWKATITILGQSLYRGKTFVRKDSSSEIAASKAIKDLIKFIQIKKDEFDENIDPSLEETETEAELMTMLKIIDSQLDFS